MGVALVSAVCIALACCNGEAWLPALLDSLRAQTVRDFRVLWQDDGSTDGTVGLLERVTAQDGRFSPGCEQGKHLGAKGNFLSLMRQADAPYVALCDQDDVWHRDRLEAGLRALAGAEEAFGADTPLLAHSDCRLTDADGHVFAESFFRHQGWSADAVTLPQLLVQNNVTGCTVLMNRVLCRLCADHAVPERLFMHDWFIAQTAAAFGKILCLPEPLVDYRQHGGNAVGASGKGLLARGMEAFVHRGRVRGRISLCYRQAEALLDAYASLLPAAPEDCIRTFLRTEHLPKLSRLAALRRGGYQMQSRTARLGQMIFG